MTQREQIQSRGTLSSCKQTRHLEPLMNLTETSSPDIYKCEGCLRKANVWTTFPQPCVPFSQTYSTGKSLMVIAMANSKEFFVDLWQVRNLITSLEGCPKSDVNTEVFGIIVPGPAIKQWRNLPIWADHNFRFNITNCQVLSSFHSVLVYKCI